MVLLPSSFPFLGTFNLFSSNLDFSIIKKVKNKSLLDEIGFKTQVTHEDALVVLQFCGTLQGPALARYVQIFPGLALCRIRTLVLVLSLHCPTVTLSIPLVGIWVRRHFERLSQVYCFFRIGATDSRAA